MCDRGAEVAMLKYLEFLRFCYHDPHRHEEQTDAARGGLPGVLKAKALVFCARKIGGAWCKGSIRARRPRGGRSNSICPDCSRREGKMGTGGDLIPEETDPWDPAPRALAPEEPESRDAQRTVVRWPTRRRCPRRTSGAYRPRQAMHYRSDSTPVERASSASPT